MLQNFKAGDFLIFQVEAGFGLLRILAIDENEGETIWHISAYSDMFPDPEIADAAIAQSSDFRIAIPHAALTNRAFESTQTARMENVGLNEKELVPLNDWRNSETREVSDRSVRLLLGLR